MTLDEYLALITSEHTGKPKFEATVAAGVSPLVKVQAVLKSLIAEFDIDSAVGVQLDKIGEWVGFPRQISVQLIDVYFAWDENEQVGWDSGRWKDQYDPDTGPTYLTDEEYRTLLKAKISFNRWRGSASEAYDVWEQAFDDGSFILIQDGNDMSMRIAIAGKELSIIEKKLIVGGGILMKPEGVRISDVVFTKSDSPIFCFDADSSRLAGWDKGNWSESYFDF